MELCGRFKVSFESSDPIMTGIPRTDNLPVDQFTVTKLASVSPIFKEKITIKMKISGDKVPENNLEIEFVFDFVFYDCTTETEPKYPISYLILDTALGGPLSRTVTLPNTTGQ